MDILTATEVAELLRVRVKWIYQQTRQGLLPHIKVGRNYRYERSAIEKWIQQQQRESCPENP